MQNRRRVNRLLAVGLVGASLLAACGSDDDGGSSTTPAGSTGATEAPADTAADDTTPPDTAAPDTATADTAATEAGGTIDAEARTDAIELSPEELTALGDLAPGQLVGIVAATMATDYHKTLNESVKARAEELGFDAEIFDSQEDPNQQLQGIEGFISKGAAAIIVTGLGGETIGPVADEAASNGHLRRPGRRARSQRERRRHDQRRGGGHRHRRRHSRRRVRRRDVRRRADRDGHHRLPVDRVARRSGRHDRGRRSSRSTRAATFLPRILGGTAENGVTSMETALQANPDITGVLGINDAGNLGAYQALENAGKTADDVFIFGIDCEAQARRADRRAARCTRAASTPTRSAPANSPSMPSPSGSPAAPFPASSRCPSSCMTADGLTRSLDAGTTVRRTAPRSLRRDRPGLVRSRRRRLRSRSSSSGPCRCWEGRREHCGVILNTGFLVDVVTEFGGDIDQDLPSVRSRYAQWRRHGYRDLADLSAALTQRGGTARGIADLRVGILRRRRRAGRHRLRPVRPRPATGATATPSSIRSTCHRCPVPTSTPGSRSHADDHRYAARPGRDPRRHDRSVSSSPTSGRRVADACELDAIHLRDGFWGPMLYTRRGPYGVTRQRRRRRRTSRGRRRCATCSPRSSARVPQRDRDGLHVGHRRHGRVAVWVRRHRSRARRRRRRHPGRPDVGRRVAGLVGRLVEGLDQPARQPVVARRRRPIARHAGHVTTS